jgi:hypothetical protein
MNPAEDDHCIGEGFHLLFKLYGSITMSGDHSQAYVAQTHLSRTLPIHLEPTRIQAVDLQVTQHWLAIMTWRSCNRNDFITVGMSDTAYPISISQNLLSISNQWSREKAKGSWVVSEPTFPSCILICSHWADAYL